MISTVGTFDAGMQLTTAVLQNSAAYERGHRIGQALFFVVLVLLLWLLLSWLRRRT